MKKQRFSFSVKIISAVCAAALLFSSCGGGIKTMTVKHPLIKNETARYTGDEYHRSAAANYTSVCKSGLIELLFDEKTMTAAVRDTSSDALWSTLPKNDIFKQLGSSAVEVELSNGGDTVYTLNSQDNSLYFGNASYTLSENGVAVKYAIALDRETGSADIASLTDRQIRVDLTVLYTLKDGSFYVEASMNNLKLPEGVFLEKIRLLNDFGAYEQSSADDYIFVPDGSGALIMTGIPDDGFSPVKLSVYGEDRGIDGSSRKSECLVGAFGMKRGGSAFLCIIEQGDTIAEISANRNGETSLNSVNAAFKTTDICTEQNEKEVKKTYGYQYKNEIKLCYRFLSGKSATYSGMATACRENLIRNSVLSTKTVKTDEENLPFVLALQGGYINGNGKYFVLSDYEKAQSLLTLLKAKGINNVYLRYNGLYGGANNGTAGNFSRLKTALGSSEKFSELYSYINSQKFSLFIDTDILTFSYKSSDSAKKITGSKMKSDVTENLSMLGATSAQGYSQIANLEADIEALLSESERISFDGYALNDMGSYLYSDYSSDFYSRDGAKKEIAAQIPVIATSKKLMIDTGNFYAIKSADIITEIPMAPIIGKPSEAYKGIPFVQMMLHGISEYSASGINTADNSKYAFLKALEYGCLPSAEWYCTKYSEQTDGKYYYDSNINDLVSYYIKANEVLYGLRDARMTAHYEVQKDFYCTEYNNSTKVYVNFSAEPITVNGITVGAMDCVKI